MLSSSHIIPTPSIFNHKGECAVIVGLAINKALQLWDTQSDQLGVPACFQNSLCQQRIFQAVSGRVRRAMSVWKRWLTSLPEFTWILVSIRQVCCRRGGRRKEEDASGWDKENRNLTARCGKKTLIEHAFSNILRTKCECFFSSSPSIKKHLKLKTTAIYKISTWKTNGGMQNSETSHNELPFLMSKANCQKWFGAV